MATQGTSGTETGLTGGPLKAAIARAVVRSHRTYVGRGPTKAQALFCKHVLVVVMEDTLTKAERVLVADGQADVVARMRNKSAPLLRAELAGLVEDLTCRAVLSCHSTDDIESDVSVDLFVLGAPLGGAL